VAPAQYVFGRLGERQDVLRVPAPQVRRLASALEPLRRVPADRLEEPVSHLPVLLLGHDERRVDEMLEQRQCLLLGLGETDRRRHVERETSDEHGQPSEQALLIDR
jgi:hypothetical protein